MSKKHLFILTACLLLGVASCHKNKKNNNTQTLTQADSSSNQVKENYRSDLNPINDSSTAKIPYYKVLETGLKYHVFDYHPKQVYPNPGDVIYLSMQYFLRDSLLFSSTELADTMKMRMKKPDVPGSIDEALFQMHQYDSAKFILDANKFYTHTRKLKQLPAFIRIGDSLRFNIRLIKVVPAAQWEKQQAQTVQEKRDFEASEIHRYLLDNKINAEEINGVYREITHKGKGGVITDNSQVSIHYTGKLLDNSVFSSTYKSQNTRRHNAKTYCSF